MAVSLINRWDAQTQRNLRDNAQRKAWKARHNVEAAKELYDQGLISIEVYVEIVSTYRDLVAAKNLACKEPDAPPREWDSRIDLNEVINYLGQGFHTAFRKGTDDDAAHFIHAAIDELDPVEWQRILRFVAGPLWEGIKRYGIVEEDHDA